MSLELNLSVVIAMEMDIGKVKICCSVGLKGGVQRFGLEATRGSVLLSAEGWMFILSLRKTYSLTVGQSLSFTP